MCEPGDRCSDCQYFQEVETDYDIEIRCAKYDANVTYRNNLMSKSKTELIEKLSEAIPNDANVTFATATWWNDEGTFNWDSDSDEVT